MATKPKPSLDELFGSERSLQTKETGRGTAIVKAIRAPTTWNDATKTASYVMSTQAEDRYGDVVITKGISLENFILNPIALLAHASRDWSIGTWGNVKKVASSPPRLEGDLALDTDDAAETPDDAALKARTVARKIARGEMRACSIGFMPFDWEWIKDAEDNYTNGLRFIESDLLECSPCNVPAHPAALIKEAGGDPLQASRLIARQIDEWQREFEDVGFKREDFIAALRAYEPIKTTVVIENRTGADVTVTKADDVQPIQTPAPTTVAEPAPAATAERIAETPANVAPAAPVEPTPEQKAGILAWLLKALGITHEQNKEAPATAPEPTVEPKKSLSLEEAEDAAAAKMAARALLKELSDEGSIAAA